jgi:ABC-type sugar transport system permease subunit
VTVQSVVAMLVNNVQSGAFGTASAIGWVLFIIIFGVYMILYKGIGFGREE